MILDPPPRAAPIRRHTATHYTRQFLAQRLETGNGLSEKSTGTLQKSTLPTSILAF